MTTVIGVIERYIKRIEQGVYTVVEGHLYNKHGKKLGTINKRGYRVYSSTVNGKQILVYAHRLMFAYYNGLDNLNPKLTINHIDGNKDNNRNENLEQISKLENTKHQWDNDLGKRGSECSYAKLTEDDVVKIKRMLREGLAQRKIAEMFNVSRSAILQINRGYSWKHVN